MRHRVLLRAHGRRLRAGARRPLPRRVGNARRLRNIVHLTVGGCLGPCALANVVLLILDGQALWFHSVNTEALVVALYDHIEGMLEAAARPAAPPALAARQFTASTWQPRPDGQPVDDHRPRRAQASLAPSPGLAPPPPAAIEAPRSRSRRRAPPPRRPGRTRRGAAPQRRAGLRRAVARARLWHGGGAVRRGRVSVGRISPVADPRDRGRRGARGRVPLLRRLAGRLRGGSTPARACCTSTRSRRSRSSSSSASATTSRGRRRGALTIPGAGT